VIPDFLTAWSIFKPASDIAPDWGKEITEKLIAECK